MNSARIFIGPKGHQITVNNEDVTGACKSIIWSADDTGDVPDLQIELEMSEVTIAEGRVELTIDFGASALLRKHGWTPPESGPRVLE